MQELVLIPVGFQEVDAGDLERVILINAGPSGRGTFELTDRAGSNHDGVQIELLGQFLLPLLTQIRRAQHADSLDFAAVEQFPCDQQGFDGLAHPYVIGHQNAHRVETKRHQQGNKLVNARPDGYAAE